jgi:hypothetical protein
VNGEDPCRNQILRPASALSGLVFFGVDHTAVATPDLTRLSVSRTRRAIRFPRMPIMDRLIRQATAVRIPLLVAVQHRAPTSISIALEFPTSLTRRVVEGVRKAGPQSRA